MARAGAVGVVLALLVGAPLPSSREEYRLRVASLYEDAFYALLGARGTGVEGRLDDGSRMIGALDAGRVSAGVFLYDGALLALANGMAKGLGAARVRAKGPEEAAGSGRWTEVRWEGNPGERSVWVLTPPRRRQTDLRDVALKGVGPLVRQLPRAPARTGSPFPVVSMPLAYIQAHGDDAALWQRLSGALDLGEGVAVVVGDNSSSIFADHVFIVVQHAPAAQTYSVVLAWTERLHEREAGGDRNPAVLP